MEEKIEVGDFEIDITDIIGEGQYGKVYGCFRKGNSEKMVAKILKELDTNFDTEANN